MKLSDAESLLSSKLVETKEEKRDIDPTSVEIDDELFTIAKTRNFHKQYANSYAVRLWTIKPILEEKIAETWSEFPKKKIADLCQTDKPSSPKKGEKAQHGQNIAFKDDLVVVLVGTIFKQQPLKPSILQELGEELNIKLLPVRKKFTSEEDVLVLEDEHSRVRLLPQPDCGIDLHGMVNGVICAVKGIANSLGQFEVIETIFPTPREPIWPQIKASDRAEMIFISGLQIGLTMNFELELELLSDYLTGIAGCPSEHETELVQKARLFILGNSFLKDDDESLNKIQNKVAVAQKFDQFLEDICKTMEVFLVPDEDDPVEPMMPQAPFHKCILPLASNRKTFHALSNPAKLKLPLSFDGSGEKVEMILNGGWNVRDAMKYSNVECPLEMSKKFLDWGHICPTTPDTLPLIPGTNDDVFVLKEFLPHLFVVGNQEEFSATTYKGTTIISLPRFSTSKTGAIFTKDSKVVPLRIALI